MKNTIDISVIIPAYNEEALLGRAIDSVMKQSSLPQEIIVIDDGSTDGTGDVAKSYENVRYVKKENGGLAAARNTGIEASSCEFVAFLDSDDEWNEEYLENAWHLLSNNPEINWCCTSYDRRLVNGDIGFTKSVDKIWIKDGVIEDYFICEAHEHFSLPTVMIVRRVVLISVGMFDSGISQLGEDLDMWFRIALDSPKIVYSNKVGAQYWEREGSITDYSLTDIPRFLNRIQRTESAALSKGSEARELSEKMVVDWLQRAIKESIRQFDKNSMAYIRKYYGNRISTKYSFFLMIAINMPTLVIKVFFDIRKALIN